MPHLGCSNNILILKISIIQLDKMSEMCGRELKKHNVTCLSLWPGLVQTEAILAAKETIQKAVCFKIISYYAFGALEGCAQSVFDY